MKTLRKLFIVGMGLLGALSMTGCGEKDDKTAKSLNLRLKNFAISADPKMLTSTDSLPLIGFIHARLLRSGADGRPVGEVAESWKWSSEKVLRLKLRSGIRFSNEKKLTAQDAAFSLCRNLQPGAPYSWLFSNIVHAVNKEKKSADCTGLKADGNTLEITVSDHPKRLLIALSSSIAGIVPVGSKPGEFGKMPSAGAYKIKEIRSNSSVTLIAHDGGAVKPKLNVITFSLIPDKAEAAARFKRGDLDVLEVGTPRLLRLISDKDGKMPKGTRLEQSDAHRVRILIVNEDKIAKKLKLSAGAMVKFMQSLKAKVQNADFASIYKSVGQPLRTAFFPARKLVVSGSKDIPFDEAVTGTLNVITQSDQYSGLIASKIPAKIGGISIAYKGMDKNVMLGKLIKKDYDIVSMKLEAMADADFYWSAFFTPGKSFTLFGKSLKGMKDIAGSGDNATLARAHMIDTKGNWIPLFQEKGIFAFGKNVSGEKFLPTGAMDYVGLTKE